MHRTYRGSINNLMGQINTLREVFEADIDIVGVVPVGFEQANRPAGIHGSPAGRRPAVAGTRPAQAAKRSSMMRGMLDTQFLAMYRAVAIGKRRNARARKTTSRSPILSYVVQQRRCHE